MVTTTELCAVICALAFGICLALGQCKIACRPLRVGLKISLIPLAPLALIFGYFAEAEAGMCETSLNLFGDVMGCLALAFIGYALIRPKQAHGVLTKKGKLLYAKTYGATLWQVGRYAMIPLLSYCWFWIAFVSLSFILFAYKPLILPTISISAAASFLSTLVLAAALIMLGLLGCLLWEIGKGLLYVGTKVWWWMME